MHDLRIHRATSPYVRRTESSGWAHREHNMPTAWVASSTALPPEGESVQFVLDGREVAMDGTYTHQTFQSRWSGYDVQRVRSWRPASVLL